MKKRFFNILSISFLLINLICFLGCGTIEQTIYLGDVEVNAPIVPPPTHINVNKDVGSVTISPHFSYLNTNSKISGSTDGKYTGTFRLDDSTTYKAKKNNLDWSLYKYTAGLDLDIKVSKSVSIFGGMNYSKDKENYLLGGNFGIGFHNHGEKYIARFDLGFTVQEYDFTAITIVQTKTTSIFGSDESWDIFADKGSTTNINPFATLTVNSSYDSSFFNWFIIGGYFTQNLLGYDPGTYSYPLFPFPITYTKIDKRSDMVTGFIYFNPGIAITLNDQFKLLLSAKILNEVMSTTSKQWFFMPSAQINFQI